MSLALVATLLGFSIRPEVSDLYYVRVITGLLGYMVDCSNYFVAGGVVLLLFLVVIARKFTLDMPASLIVFGVFRILLLIRRVVTGESTIAIEGLALLLLSGVTIGILSLSRDEAAHRPVMRLARCMWITGLIYLSINVYLHFFRFEAVSNGKRFFGLSSHPNEFGISLALLCAWSLFVGGVECGFKRMTAWLFVMASAYYIILSGSRSAAVSYLLVVFPFVIFELRRRLWLASVVAVFSLGVVGFAWYWLNANQPLLDDVRVLSADNTRSGVFTLMLENFIANPLVGNPATVGGTSNTILYAASSTGVVGLVLLLFVVIFAARDMTRLWRRFTGEDRFSRYIRALCLSLGLCLCWSLMFSGYALETMQFPLVCMLMSLAMLGRMTELRSHMSRSVRVA